MFKLVYATMPSDAELDAIEQIALVDEVPPSTPLGTGLLSVLVVGETEKGVFTPQRITGVTDYGNKYGGLGWTTSEGKHRGAVARRSGGTSVWNGNLAQWRAKKRFGGLVVCRVDNSAGSVQFRRLAAIKGGRGPFAAANGATITFQRNGATDVVGTFTGVKARIAGIAGTFPTLFTGGESFQLSIDGAVLPTVLMTAVEQSNAQVVARINAVTALPIASVVGGQVVIDSVIAGTSGRVAILGGTALATLGFSATPIQDVWTWTMVNAQVGAYKIRVAYSANGVSTNVDGDYASLDVVEANLNDGLLADLTTDVATADIGAAVSEPTAVTLRITAAENMLVTASVVTEVSGGDITVAHTTVGYVSEASGTGNVPDLAYITSTDAAVLFGALANLDSYVDSDGFVWVADTATPASGTLAATAGVYADFGFDTVLANAAIGSAVTLPAGTRLEDTLDQVWVTMEDYATDTSGGAFSVKVRPWDDTDSVLAAGIGTITTVLSELPGYWAVTNSAAVTRLSAAQLDSRYAEALDRTLDLNSEAADCRMVASARHSASINRSLKENAYAATAGGCDARIAVVSPIIGTVTADALSESATGVGVGSVRGDRVLYCFPGVRIEVKEISSVGAIGGIGFTNDGIIEQGTDSWMCAVRSRIPAHHSAGKNLRDSNVGELPILSLEADYESSLGGTGLELDDYKQFKAKGIAAIRRMKGIGYVFQSDVTAVVRELDKPISPAYRRFVTDNLIDDGYTVCVKYKDEVNSAQVRSAIQVQLRGLLQTYVRSGAVVGYEVKLDSSKEQLDAGLLIFIVSAKLAGIINAIALRLRVGAEGVDVEELAKAA